MSARLTQMPKPEAGQFEGERKLFLVPTFLLPADIPEDGQKLLESYWSEVRDHIENLERSLGRVSHVFHEIVYSGGDEGLKMVLEMNPKGYSFIQAICKSDSTLEATEDRVLVEESADWQRCLTFGLVSQRVVSMAIEGYQQAVQGRFEHIGKRIDDTLQKGEAGALFIREDHRVQFSSDIKVFYVAPPSLDALKRWIGDQMRPPAPPPAEPAETTAPADSPEPSE